MSSFQAVRTCFTRFRRSLSSSVHMLANQTFGQGASPSTLSLPFWDDFAVYQYRLVSMFSQCEVDVYRFASVQLNFPILTH